MCSSPRNRSRNQARKTPATPTCPIRVQPSHSERIGANGKLPGAMGTSASPTPEEAFGVSTIPQLLERAARTETAITVIDRDLNELRGSFAEYEERGRRAARGLRAAGVEPGDPVCLLGSTSPDFLATLFGVWRAGAIPSVLALPRRTDLETYIGDVQARVTSAGAKLVAIDDQF